MERTVALSQEHGHGATPFGVDDRKVGPAVPVKITGHQGISARSGVVTDGSLERAVAFSGEYGDAAAGKKTIRVRPSVRNGEVRLAVTSEVADDNG